MGLLDPMKVRGPTAMLLMTSTCVMWLTACGAVDKLKKSDNGKGDDDAPADAGPQPDAPDDPAGPLPESPGEPGDPQTPSTTNAVLIFMGGFSSCGTDSHGKVDPTDMLLTKMYEASAKANSAANGGVAPATILSCYAMSPDEISYVLSTEPNSVKTTTVAKALAAFDKMLDTFDQPDVLIVGHSYGAYTALQWLMGWSLDLRLDGLVTIDPISKVGCTPTDVAAAVLASQPMPPGCLEAPSDLTEAQLGNIKSIAGNWLNYYQEDSPYLRSGQLEGATNIKLTYTSEGLDPHLDIASDAEAIDDVLEVVRSMNQ
jgi:pimeloyl-ACP methyl ester carboxylesterase